MPDKSDRAPSPHGEPDILRYTTPKRLKLWGIIGVVVAATIAVVGLATRYLNSRDTAAWTADQAIPTVQLVKLSGVKGGGDLTLPGDVEAFTNAPIYAQVSGTLQKWNFDIGAHVKKGDVLAQIDPRPYQAALAQARGQLARDSATLANARVDLGRYRALAAQNAISSQVLASQQTTVAADTGIVQTDQAQVQIASINLGYTTIKAPFDGIVTSRAVDVGNLVSVGTASATPLFTVTEQDKLRIYVHVPQDYSTLIKPGLTVNFTVPEYPGRTFAAKLAASAGAVSSASGTQLVQFQIDNSDRALKPGDYAEAHFTLPAGGGLVRVPATALMFRDSGMMVATVDRRNHVVLKPITIATDLGSAVEVEGGVTSSDRVIDNPSDSLEAGDTVRVTSEQPNKGSAGP